MRPAMLSVFPGRRRSVALPTRETMLGRCSSQPDNVQVMHFWARLWAALHRRTVAENHSGASYLTCKFADRLPGEDRSQVDVAFLPSFTGDPPYPIRPYSRTWQGNNAIAGEANS